MKKRECAKPLLVYLAAIIFSCTILFVFVVPALATRPNNLSDETIPSYDYDDQSKAYKVQLRFLDSFTAVEELVAVVKGPIRARFADPPFLHVEVKDIYDGLVERFSIWHPLLISVKNNLGEVRPVVLKQGLSKILFPFQPNIAKMEVFDVPGGQKIVSVDVIPAGHDYCRNNRSDPDCTDLLNRPPICNAGGPYQKECAGKTTSVTLNGTGSRDLDRDPMTYTWNGPFAGGTVTGATPAVQFSGFGSFGVSLGVRDDFGSTVVCSSAVAVVDTTPPTIQSVSATPNILWPPDHKMLPVNVKVLSSDICDPALACRISSVSSNEPVNGLGDGDTAPDWVITGDFTLNLRAERSGTGKGRIYTISVMCTDDSGNSSAATTNVRVPFAKGK
jgi:hypothetical protein